MTKQFRVDPEDQALFRQSVGSVKRLRHDRIEPSPSGPAPVPYSTRADESRVLRDMVSDYFEPAEIETGEEIYYCSEGIQRSVLRKLRRGQFRVSAMLDLHGMTVVVARRTLIAFLRAAKRKNMTCVRIVHGKGNRSRHRGPVLKQKVNHWLRQREDILAFCSARPVDGGTGAIYVLLKRQT